MILEGYELTKMKAESIKTHLKVYSIKAKRKTTISHAFASALAQVQKYEDAYVKDALRKLGQSDFNSLFCVYCKATAQTWDHLTNLVKDGRLHGFGHVVGNLVPCCKSCNSAKGKKSFPEFINSLPNNVVPFKFELIQNLEEHQKLATQVGGVPNNPKLAKLLKKYYRIHDDVIDLLAKADEYADAIRKLIEEKVKTDANTSTEISNKKG